MRSYITTLHLLVLYHRFFNIIFLCVYEYSSLLPILFPSLPLLHFLPLLSVTVTQPSRISRCSLSVKKKRVKMNTLRSCEEMRIESVVCPKPRRLGLGLFNSSSIINNIRPLRCPISYLSETEDSSAVGEELLHIILPKERFYEERNGGQVVASSPPFFCGSPPSRASNPIIEDEQFGNGNFNPFISSPSSSSARGCVRVKFGHAPAAVRIEGFDSLNRDRSSCSISAVA
ncbi:hypothetical protein RIF29_34957 [Crotalaria pallida]|uniref:Uncharacterized protein n=1 Tax=Crotalaria pallida TaxID=3830 RepID=A0AAN9EFC5_CROPI